LLFVRAATVLLSFSAVCEEKMQTVIRFLNDSCYMRPQRVGINYISKITETFSFSLAACKQDGEKT
jgi:hypothetical protein